MHNEKWMSKVIFGRETLQGTQFSYLYAGLNIDFLFQSSRAKPVLIAFHSVHHLQHLYETVTSRSCTAAAVFCIASADQGYVNKI